MPNRILRGQSLTSPTLDKLSDAGERLFFRLTLIADDFGRFESDACVVAAKCYPLKAVGMDLDYIKTHYAELQQVGLVKSYQVNGRSYGYFPTWGEHQRIRSKQSKYPPPPSAAGCGNLRTSAARARARPESESETESETKAIKRCGHPPPIAADSRTPDPDPLSWLNDQESEELKKILPTVMAANRSTFPKIQNLLRHWMQIRPPWPVSQSILEKIRQYHPEEPEGYAHKIMAIEEGNYHASQAVARHTAIKEADQKPVPIIQIDRGMEHVGAIPILKSLAKRAEEAPNEDVG